MRTFLLRSTIWSLLSLCSCASEPPVLEPVRVEVPIAVPCITKGVEKPDFALSHVSTADNIAVKTRAAFVELHQRKAYEAQLEALEAACK